MNHLLSSDKRKIFFEEMRKMEGDISELLNGAGLLIQKGQYKDGNSLLDQSLCILDDHYSKWCLFLEDLPEYWDSRYKFTKSDILQSMGQNFYRLNDLKNSKAKFEEALQLLDDEHSISKAYLLRFLAGICSSMESFQEASAYFQSAFKEFLVVGNLYQFQGGHDQAKSMVIEAGNTLSFSASIFLSLRERNNYIQRLEEIIQFAERNDLSDLRNKVMIDKFKFQMENDPSGHSLQEYADMDKIKELRSISKIPAFELDALMLLAEISRKRGNYKDAEKQLLRAKSASQNAPHRRWSVLLALADILETIGKQDEAIKILQEAENLSHQENIPGVLRVIQTNLIPLLLASDNPTDRDDAEKRISALKKQGELEIVFSILINRALLFSKGGHPDLAMDDLNEAFGYAKTWDDKIKVIQAKIGTLSKIGDNERALALSSSELDAFMNSLGTDVGENIIEWKTLLGSIETLYMNAAFMAAELGRLPEAWEWAENGRALRLRFQLSRRYPESFSGNRWMKVSYNDALDFLRRDNSAIVTYSFFEHKTLVIVIDPRTDIRHEIIDNFGNVDLKHLMPEEQIIDMFQWNQCVLQALSQIPADLVDPLNGVNTHNIYISPDSLLYSLPFYAIGFGDGTHVIDRYCTSIIPSFAILKFLRSRREQVSDKSCLAFGSGEECKFHFIDQASHVSRLPWKSSVLLPNQEDIRSIKEHLLSLIGSVNVVHIACHGTTADLELDKDLNIRLKSKDIDNLNGLNLDLVFLNACVSGSYIHVLPSEIGGFWEAFLLSGVRTVISTLSYVNPADAHEISMSFYESWLNGMNKAEALRTAQLRIKNRGENNWATHIILGDIN